MSAKEHEALFIMIRSNLPLPFLYRLRLQAGAAARRATSSPSDYRSARPAAGRAVNPLLSAARRAALPEAAQFWLRFIDQYESFTTVLCAAAMNGCDSIRESEYAQLRRWFVANYYRTVSRVRPFLDAEFVSGAEVDTPIVVDYAGQRRALDPLESLFLPATLRDVLKHDTGDLIPRVARISDAVYRCHADWEESQSSL